MKLDDIDLKILRELQADARIRVVDLAEKVGLSATPCQRRIKILEDEGVIRRYATLLNAEKLGYPVNVFIYVQLERKTEAHFEAFETEIRKHPEVMECHVVTGQHDYLLRVIARSIEDYERFLKTRLLHLPGVGSVSSNVALKKVKLTTDVPT